MDKPAHSKHSGLQEENTPIVYSFLSDLGDKNIDSQDGLFWTKPSTGIEKPHRLQAHYTFIDNLVERLNRSTPETCRVRLQQMIDKYPGNEDRFMQLYGLTPESYHEMMQELLENFAMEEIT